MERKIWPARSGRSVERKNHTGKIIATQFVPHEASIGAVFRSWLAHTTFREKVVWKLLSAAGR